MCAALSYQINYQNDRSHLYCTQIMNCLPSFINKGLFIRCPQKIVFSLLAKSLHITIIFCGKLRNIPRDCSHTKLSKNKHFILSYMKNGPAFYPFALLRQTNVQQHRRFPPPFSFTLTSLLQYYRKYMLQ